MLETKVTFNKGYRLFDTWRHRDEIRVAMERSGRIVRREAQRLVIRRSIAAQAGDGPSQAKYPLRVSGALVRAIRYTVAKSGLQARVVQVKTADMGRDFYPAILVHGTRGEDGKEEISPRGNYIVDALKNRRNEVRKILRKAMRDAVKKAGRK